jgi:hypothetical protein
LLNQHGIPTTLVLSFWGTYVFVRIAPNDVAFVLLSDEQFLYNLKECEEIHPELLCLIMLMGFSYLSGGNT